LSAPVRKFRVYVVVLWDPEADGPADLRPEHLFTLGDGTVERQGTRTTIVGPPLLVSTVAGLVGGVVTGGGKIGPCTAVLSDAGIIALSQLDLLGPTPLN
jgi:hypothetical protein